MLETYQTDDIDVARRIGSRFLFDHHPTPTRPGGAFSFDVAAGRMGAMSAGLVRYGQETDVRIGATARYTVNIALEGTYALRTRRQELEVGAGSAAITGPTDSLRARGWAKGTERALLVTFEQRDLEWELRQLVGRDVKGPIRFRPRFDLAHGRGAHWRQLTGSVGEAMSSTDSLAWNPLIGATLSRTLMAGILLAADHQYRDLLEASPQPLPMSAIRRAAATIEERAAEPITISDVAAAIGCSVRSLRAGFRNHIGMTVRSYVVRVRLDRVHADLVANGPGSATVSDIARRWGFRDLAAFGQLYEREYGEEPGRTLMRH